MSSRSSVTKRLLGWGVFFIGLLLLLVLPAGAGTGSTVMQQPSGRIAFGRPSAQQHGQIWVMNANGSGQRAITPPTWDSGLPALSPDGRRIAFTRLFDAAGGTVQDDIYVMNANGTRLHRLTASEGDEESLTWSPDGRRIAYNRLDSHPFLTAGVGHLGHERGWESQEAPDGNSSAGVPPRAGRPTAD